MTTATGPSPVTTDDASFVALARSLGRRFAPEADRHDRDNSFVHENYAAMRADGYLRLAVPTDQGGGGADLRQVCLAQAELARHCSATALAVNMHLYLTLVCAYRRGKGAADAEALLRRIASEGLVLMTSGGSDWTHPTGRALPAPGGYRVSGYKRFCSQAPIADLLWTSAPVHAHDDETDVIVFTVPMTARGISVLDTWDTLGMRATGSQDVELDDVFVPEEDVVARRVSGRLDAPLVATATHFAPTVASVYWGIGRAARDEALRIVRHRSASADLSDAAAAEMAVGRMDHALQVSWWALMGSVNALSGDYTCSPRSMTGVMHAKLAVVRAAIEVTDIAMSLVGGGAYFRTSVLERLCRDVRAGAFHPLNPDATIRHAGASGLRGSASEDAD